MYISSLTVNAPDVLSNITVDDLKQLVAQRDFYKRRVDIIRDHISTFPEPSRMLLCDLLDHAELLPP